MRPGALVSFLHGLTSPPQSIAAHPLQGKTPVWHALDLRYDQCIGNCECLPGRDMKEDYITIHFRCGGG